MTISLTPRARDQLDILRVNAPAPVLYLRLTVDSGGCQGFSYTMELVQQTAPDDAVFMDGHVGVATDSVSMPFLNGATVDFEDSLVSAKFIVKNPNASSGCGCGTSFGMPA